MFKSTLVLIAALAAVVVADERVSVKGYTANNKDSALSCKFGSGDILKACGKCAESITECATAPNASAATSICVKDIASFASDCGGCAVDILECL